MTPKEKAERLLFDYDSILINDISHTASRNYSSFQCAMRTINETLRAAYYADDEIYDYYLEVKQEIEKL